MYFIDESVKMNNEEIIYSLNIADMQTVAEDVIERKLSPSEIELLIDSPKMMP